ncbi:MAG TPA: PQQ-binding-like beta-propeller repeat protein [Pirellulaceae bacterium]|jgi:outer membrane protein assembly factor BamB|nr:PQQ-binding-like beta-propeller repeat protein [Pirellulaceae bacterium]
MTGTLRSSLVLLLLLAGGSSAFAQVEGPGSLRNLSEYSLKQFDLERMWSVQIATDVRFGGLAAITAYVSPSRSTTLYHVASGDELLVTVSELQLDAFGRKLGPEGARARAEKELAALQAADPELKAEVTKRVVPQVTLYCMAKSGLVHALDAETGATLWVRQFGSPTNPPHHPGVNDKYLAIANGNNVYVADSQTGEILYESALASLAGAGPAVSDQLVHIPLADGFLESHYLRQPEERISRSHYRFRSIGQHDVQPIVLGSTMAWPSTRGYLYVGDANRNAVRYRLEGRDAIRAKPAFGAGNRILVGSVDGNLYCLQERSGTLEWRFTTGQPIIESPFVVGEDVYVTNEYGGIFSIDLTTGQERWWAPAVTRVISASPTRVYGIGDTGSVYVLDRASGGLVGTIPLLGDNVSFVNTLTDRIVLATQRGRVVSFRETSATYPVVHAGDTVTTPADPAAQPGQKGQPGQNPAGGTPPATVDPFATPAGADPFAAPSGADPFGTTPPAGGAMPADPFATPPAGGAAPVDPFATPPAGGAMPADPFATPPAGGAAPGAGAIPNDPFAS